MKKTVNDSERRQYEDDARYIEARSVERFDVLYSRAVKLATDPDGEFQRGLTRFRAAIAALRIYAPFLLLTLLLTACSSSGSSPTAPDSGGAWVEYHVTGTGTSRANLITYATANAGTAQAGPAALPWRFEWLAKAGDHLYVSAQNDNASGCIKVLIMRRNVQWRETESCGAYVIATASGTS